MSGLDGSKGYVRLAARAVVLLLAASSVTPADPNSSAVLPVLRESLASNVRISDPARAAAVRKALLGAFDRLGDPKCQGIFSEFRDASGRTLQENLDAQGRTGQSYLKLVLFYEGSNQRACSSSRGEDVSAATATGSRVVFICAGNFSEKRRPKPFGPEAVIIHEALHSLGLGENPPTSDEITWQVFSRCAR
jgi:hypothetical protein